MPSSRQVPRHKQFLERQKSQEPLARDFNYRLHYQELDLRKQPELYRVGRGEQGVLLVEPYKSEILPYWRFKTPEEAEASAKKIFALFKTYKRQRDFVGMDMARKFLQMGYTRSRRYANHRSGRKYDNNGNVLPRSEDPIKAASARIFYEYWKRVEADAFYSASKERWKKQLG